MKKYKDHTLKDYLEVLSQKTPAPGGGSAAALTASLGTALLAMVANYSLGRKQPKSTEQRLKNILKASVSIRRELLRCVDLDAEVYLKVVLARGKSNREKAAALRQAARVPLKVSRLCYKAIGLASDLVKRGNPHLISDIEVAAELLLAAFNAALITVEINR